MKIENFNHPSIKYSFLKKLGDGSASKIFVAQNKITKEKVITKRINKKEEWRNELNILKHLNETTDNKRLLKYVDFFETDRFAYIMTEMYKGYDLFDHIDINVPYTLKYSKLLIKEMAKCIRDCHKLNIAHLDIKCENYMSLQMEPVPKLILIDFGHAEKIDENIIKRGYSKYGTSFYLCPEGYNRIYSTKSDIWSLGICAHLILTGDYPFDNSEKDYSRNVKTGNVCVNKKLDDVSYEFISRCLMLDPIDRFDINELLESQFFV